MAVLSGIKHTQKIKKKKKERKKKKKKKQQQKKTAIGATLKKNK